MRSDNSAGASRCVAALLTAYEGNHTAADLHLRRATELLPTAAPVGDPLLDTQIQVAIAVGDPLDALERISGNMAEALDVNPIAADEWLEGRPEPLLSLSIVRPTGAPEKRCCAGSSASRRLVAPYPLHSLLQALSTSSTRRWVRYMQHNVDTVPVPTSRWLSCGRPPARPP